MDAVREVERDRPRTWWISAVAVAALMIVVDLATDVGEGVHPAHIVVEILSALLLLSVAVGMFRQIDRRMGLLHHDLSRTREEAERWREEASQLLRGLGAAIDRQFERWELTPAEREVALLLLKGLSLKEVARVRSTSERTARDQARAIYRKGGLSGRSELSAFFLEDLLLPRG